jgi:membrane-associated phospholipid phosphatase
MAAGTGIYITWITGAIILSIAMMPLFKPPYAKLRLEGFIDMFRRYWAHMIVVFSVYLWKDLLDGMDRVLMASTKLDMTPYVYAIEGDIVLWVQQELRNAALDQMLTHFYVMGFMTATFASFLYPIYFDDRHMADRVSLSMFWVYIIAIPFFLFFNVGVTGDHIPSMQTIAYDLTPEIHNWFTRIDPFSNGMPSLHIGLPFAIWLTMQRWDEDGRWVNYRNFLIVFMLVTAFSIIYLGIHWIVDIIGGMAVAILAVELTAKTHSSIWRVADERLFSRRLARAIADPGKSLRGTLPEQRVLSLRASKGTQQEADQRNHRHSSAFDLLRFALGCYPPRLPGRGRGMADFCGRLRRMAGLSRRGTGRQFGNQRVERQRRGRQRSFRGSVGNSSDGFHLGSVPSAA